MLNWIVWNIKMDFALKTHNSYFAKKNKPYQTKNMYLCENIYII